MRYRRADDCKRAGVAYHMVPVDVWNAQKDSPTYIPEAFEQDGFIHCTNGLDQLVNVGNMFYTGDPRPYQVLILDERRIEPPLRYDDPEELFPHIYGALNTSAVIGMLDVPRDADGAFLPFNVGQNEKT